MMKKGFTLVEISIVLVIIGLIIGGVLVGRDLIYGSQVRRMVGDVEKYAAATNTFRTKYNCLPGDCLTATSFFAGVTNGNDDKTVNPMPAQQMGAPVEMYQFWYQLYLAGLAPAVTGAAASLVRVQAGVNIPSGSFEGSGYSIYFSTNNSGFPFFPLAKHAIAIGVTNLVDSNYIAHFPFLTPAQAYAIDVKYDDGVAGKGNMSGLNGYGGWGIYNCANLPSVTTYNLALTTPQCFFSITAPF